MKSQNKLPQSTYYIKGMHCSSCELLIERTLMKENGVKSVEVSLPDQRMQIRSTSEDAISIDKLNKKFKKYGYEFSQKKHFANDEPLLSIDKGLLKINKTKLKTTLQIVIILLILILTFSYIDSLGFSKYLNVDNNSSLTAFFILGIVAGFSSCAALVGGLLLSISQSWHESFINSESKILKAKPHIMFHIGRLVAFVLLGGLLGILGDFITFDNPIIYSILVFFVSIVMVILSLQMLGVGWANKFRFALPKKLIRYSTDAEKYKGKYIPLLIGALTFFLPCGFTLIAQGLALTSGGFLNGALTMFMFALGTFIPLAIISFTSLQFRQKPYLTAKFNIIAGILILLFAVYNINGQLNSLGLLSLNDLKMQQDQVVENIPGEVQKISLIAKDFNYILVGGNTFKAGIPTKLVVDNQGIVGCGAYLAARGLINNYVVLKPGINEFEIKDIKTGSYKITCSMGMVPPVTIKVI